MSPFTAFLVFVTSLFFSSIASHTIFNNQNIDSCNGAQSLQLYKLSAANDDSSYTALSKSLLSSHSALSLVRDCNIADESSIQTISLSDFVNVKQKGAYALVFDSSEHDELEVLMEDMYTKLRGKAIHQRKLLSVHMDEDDDEEFDEDNQEQLAEEDYDVARTLYVESYADLEKMVGVLEAHDEDTKTLENVQQRAYELVQDVVPSANSTSTELYVNADILHKGIFFAGFIAILLVFFGLMHSLQTAEHLASNLNVKDLQKK
eukprot:CAMPEP_0117440382 /NCGR_PEP_ID=MMETSP0759-20121206/3063_1 /TAXON_ID=63605 /ORGANISM="Percolomonas cosmopolitus, Strain WS" /LENGTH=261 /DNA_ID=CAMNT_0005232149 /DNA_START=5 /DNA_END=787 /DNA_ORIENTATION=+